MRISLLVAPLFLSVSVKPAVASAILISVSLGGQNPVTARRVSVCGEAEGKLFREVRCCTI